MEYFPVIDYLQFLSQKPYKIPLDHLYENAFGFYPILPIMGFTCKNGKWELQTVICIPDDGSTYNKIDQFESVLLHDLEIAARKSAAQTILKNRTDIYPIPDVLFDSLHDKVEYIHANRKYIFKYLFQVISSTITSATLVVEQNVEAVNAFEEVGHFGAQKFLISPKADNDKTVKNQLNFMAQCLKARIDYQAQPFDEISSDTEIAINRVEDDYKRIEKKPKKQWKFVKDGVNKLIVKGELSVEIYKFIKEQGYEFQDN